MLANLWHAVFDAYDVINQLPSLGQRPAVFVIDHSGIVRFTQNRQGMAVAHLCIYGRVGA